MDPGEQIPYIRILPCRDFNFNVFLWEISKQITAGELKALIAFCTGRDCLSKAVREKIDDALDLFQHLRELGLLNNENLASLQGMLWRLNRIDLCEKFIQYCRKRDSTVHFMAPSDQLIEGHQSVSFHVRGTQKLTHQALIRLRHELSSMLDCPPEELIVDGILPAASLHIMFKIPENRLKFLYSIGDREKEQLYFHGVDCFQIGEHVVYCKDFKTTEEQTPNLEKDGEVERILQENEDLTRSLSQYQMSYKDYKETEKLYNDTISDLQRDLKYSKDNSAELVENLQTKITELQKVVHEYKLSCIQLTYDKRQSYDTDDPGTLHHVTCIGKINRIRRTLSQADTENLLEISSEYQSQLIDLFQSSNASETTSSIMKILTTYKNDVDRLKATIQTLVTSALFDDVYAVVLNLKSIEDAIDDRKLAHPEMFEYESASDDDDDFDIFHG